MPEKRPTKADLRKELQQEIKNYLKRGGEVKQVPAGESGREDNNPLRTVLFDSPKEPRTCVNDLVAGIDQRRRPKKPPVVKSPQRRGRYKTLYDDFGEPIRKIWVEE